MADTKLEYVDPTLVGIPGFDSWLDGHYLAETQDRLEVDEAFLNDIMFHGVLEPVVVTEESGGLVVVAGRRRVLHARVASERLQEQGRYPVKVPIIRRFGDQGALLGVSASENVHRKAYTFYEAARKVEHMRGFGLDDKQLAIHFGVTETMIGRYQRLMKLDPRVLEKVKEGAISGEAALQLWGLDNDEQWAKVQEILAQGEKPSPKKVREARGIISPPHKRVLMRVVEHWREDPDIGVSNEFIDGVQWARGIIGDDLLPGDIRELVEKARAKK